MLAVGGVGAVTSFGAQSPKVLLASILGTARAQHSVHYVSWHSLGAAGHLVVSADVTRDRGIQHVTETLGRNSVGITVLVVAKTAYVRGGRAGLKELLGLTSAKASRYADRWISIPFAGRLFRGVATAVTLDSLLRQIEPRGRLSTALKTLKGTKVIDVRGRSRTGEVDLRARRSGLLPIEATDIAGGGMGYTTLSHWNETVKVRAPANAVPIAVVRG